MSDPAPASSAGDAPSGPSREVRTAVALSGGGHRATLWAIGVLLYLTDVGRHARVTSIASVSGGSLANAAIGHAIDYRATSPAGLEPVAAAIARRAARGTVLVRPLTWLYLAAVAGWFVLFGLGPWLTDWPLAVKVALFVLGAIIWSWLLLLRGWVAGRAFAATLFGGRPTLEELNGGVDHVICATDLHAGEHVYFARDFVCAYRFGLGSPGRLPLHRAVQASAAFPPVFPVAWIATKRFAFRDGAEPRAARAPLALTDGGVYDNMGDQWVGGLSERRRRWPAASPAFRDADELIVANASAGLGWGSTSLLRLPFLGELLALLRDKSVLYDNGTSLRRQALVGAFDLAERTGTGLRGALVHIPQSPFRTPDFYRRMPQQWPQRAARAEDAILALAGADEAASREAWKEVARANAAVKTTLVGLGDDVAARLLHHAYVLAAVNLHVILDYPLV